MKFATKLLLIMLGVSLASVIFVAVASYARLLDLSDYSQDANMRLGFYASENSKDALIEQAEAYLSRLASSRADECDAVLADIQGDVKAMARYMSALYDNPSNFRGRPLPLPYQVPKEIPTAKMMLAPDTPLTPAIEREALLISNAEYAFSAIHAENPNMSNAYIGSATGITFRWSASNSYNFDFDPRLRPWYQAAIDAGGPAWTDTYVDVYGVIMTTCATTYDDAAGRVIGVAASDVHLSTIVENILTTRIGETGYAFLLDTRGHYLAHPRYDEIDPYALGASSGTYKEALRRMVAGDSGVRQAEIDGMEYYIAFARLPTTDWSLGIAVERDEIISEALLMQADIEHQALEVKDQISAMLNTAKLRFIALTGLITIVVSALSILVSNSVTKPMTQLTNGVIEVGKGNLTNKLDIQTGDEIGVLASCFNKMTDDLSEYIENLSKVTAEKERIGAELDIATQIQASMLPSIFPAFPERAEFDIYASMEPAKEVGGDFYDFFFAGDDTLAVVIADVSGKGVPAALFMVIAKTLIKNNAQYGKNPREVFETVNNLLCENNEAGMFVTAILGYLDIPTGKFTFVNAGHNSPLLKREGERFDWLKTKPGLVLAGMEGMTYQQHETVLRPGDELFLYTDGVTEAVNNANELFGDPRLLEAANRYPDLPVQGFAGSIKREIAAFAEGAEQADDITMLALRYKGAAR